MQSVTIGVNQAGQRLDKFLHKYLPNAGNGFLYKMLRGKRIVDIQNGKTVSRRVKQTLFCIAVLAHAAEKVEMILRKIGKNDSVVHDVHAQKYFGRSGKKSRNHRHVGRELF